MQQLIGQKGQSMVVLQQGNSLRIVSPPPALQLGVDLNVAGGGTSAVGGAAKVGSGALHGGDIKETVSRGGATVGGAPIGGALKGASVGGSSVVGAATVERSLMRGTCKGIVTMAGPTSVTSFVVASTIAASGITQSAPVLSSPKFVVPSTKPITMSRMPRPVSQVPVPSSPVPKALTTPVSRLASPLPVPKPLFSVSLRPVSYPLRSDMTGTHKSVVRAPNTQGSFTPIKSLEPKPQTVTTQATTKVFVQTVSQAKPARPIVPQASPSVSAKILNKPVAKRQQQKFVLLKVNRRLLLTQQGTQQGVPVTLQGGVLRPLGPAQVLASSPKLVSNRSVNRAPVPTIRAQSSQVQKVVTTSGGTQEIQKPPQTASHIQPSLFTHIASLHTTLQQVTVKTPQLQQAVNQVQPLKFPVVPISGALSHTVSVAQPIRLQQPVSALQQFQSIKIQTPEQIQIPRQVPLQQVKLQQQPVSFTRIQAPQNSLGVQQHIQGTNNAQIQAPKHRPTPGMQQQIQGTLMYRSKHPKIAQNNGV